MTGEYYNRFYVDDEKVTFEPTIRGAESAIFDRDEFTEKFDNLLSFSESCYINSTGYISQEIEGGNISIGRSIGHIPDEINRQVLKERIPPYVEVSDVPYIGLHIRKDRIWSIITDHYIVELYSQLFNDASPGFLVHGEEFFPEIWNIKEDLIMYKEMEKYEKGKLMENLWNYYKEVNKGEREKEVSGFCEYTDKHEMIDVWRVSDKNSQISACTLCREKEKRGVALKMKDKYTPRCQSLICLDCLPNVLIQHTDKDLENIISRII